MSVLRSLLKQERLLINKLDVVQRFLTNYKRDDESQIEVRLEVLEKVYDEFFEIRGKIELLLEDVAEEEIADEKPEVKLAAQKQREADNFEAVQQFDDRYCSLKGDLMKLRPKKETMQAHGSHSQPVEQIATFCKVKLPEIRLPSYSGKVHEWVTYRDSFRSLIHNNEQLTEMDKFTYLRSSLVGEALQEINSIELSAANYDVAWAALEKRYENRKIIVKAHLDALFSLEPLKRESYEGLNHLIGEFDRNLQMLNKMNEKTEEWSTVLAYMVCSRLDTVTLRQWETHHSSKEVPKYQNLITFLRNHCSVLQSVAPAKPTSSDQRQSQSKSAVCHVALKTPGRCPFCNNSWHSAFHCAKFHKMTIPERNDAVTRNKLCRNCLQPGHFSRACEKGVCHHCRLKHHSMLHTGQVRSSVPRSQSRPLTPTPAPRQDQSNQHNQNQQAHTQSNTNNSQHTNTANTHNTTTHAQTALNQASTSHNYVALPVTPTRNILLSTAVVRLRDRFGNVMLARALLDSCSQHCLMTREFANKLQFREYPTYLTIQGIGSSVNVSTKLVSAEVGPRSRKISAFAEEMQFHVLSKLTVSLPTASLNPSEWQLPESASLADPLFYESGPVDVIIGAEFYMDLLTDGRTKVTEQGPTLQNTVFGWIVTGRVPSNVGSTPHSTTLVCSTAEIQEQLTKFWELETCRTISKLSTEETACEEHFRQTTVRDETGRYIVSLPKKEFVVERLGECRTIAAKRLAGLERRFAANPELKDQYFKFIHEYQALGHMREVEDTAEGKAYYLPHHAVLKPDSTTTKLRVVFDASCRTSSGVSLNDALMVGPVVQDDLLNIVLRFRLHKYAVVADIAKMYRMVRVQEADQRLQRILWRDSTEQALRTFELTTVTYGTASAPYLATKCLQRLAEEGEEAYPVAAKVLKKDFYVDDMLSGVDEVTEGRRFVSEMVDLMDSAGFSLRKWNSNCQQILEYVPEQLRDDRAVLELDSSSSTIKTLGLVWEPSTDNFRFSSPTWSNSAVITKRTVLAEASRLFDPLGLVGPVIVQAKMLIQELWKLECSWDEPLSTEYQEQWKEYRRNLAALDGLRAPRWVGVGCNTDKVQLIGFCDASEKAYGACIYVRTVSTDGEVTVMLLTSKSRVAPLENLKKKKKRQSIPRLELSSALLLAHLYEKVSSTIETNVQPYFFTDSTVVKCWLDALPSRWKDFVGNRTSEIQHVTKDGVWKHVAGIQNPADIISRGMTPAQLQYQSVWWQGPHWLLLDEVNWPQTFSVSEELDPSTLEERNAIAAVLPSIEPSEIFTQRSSLSELIRTTALILRFRYNSQAANRSHRREGFITFAEYDEALRTLVSLSQMESFPQEHADLSSGRPVRASSRILSLNPQLSEGIICVGGRLQHADISESRKHPFILDHRHPLSRIIVTCYHQRLFHAGQQLLISAVREQFWPTNVRNLARSVIHKCVPCFKANPRIQDQLMADLPPERVTPCFPFQRVGVDYCGPFWVVYPQRRPQPIKCFVAVYVCLVTKAVHLELVADLTTQAFLASLRRFVARRGKPTLIMCDNATNFVGAKRELDELRRLFCSQQFQQAVIKEAMDEQIEFRFIPARSPNFGGLWESAVKSFKTLLKRTIGTHRLEYDEMHTVLDQIEAILNSRPLTPLSNDPDDYEALTPGHFLIGRPLTAIPEPDLDHIPANRLSLWQRAQHFTQQMWKKWTKQYLSDLHNRTKWTRQKDNVKVGTMVVLKEENLPPLRWQLGRVTKVNPGPDGNIRVVTVRTKDGSYTRAISKVCVLPIRDNQALQ